MEKKIKPVAPWGAKVKNRIIKLITFFTCIIFITVSILFYVFSTYDYGYKYYRNNIIQIGVAKTSNIVNKTLIDYLNELEDKGYYIYSIDVNEDIICKHTIINKNDINEKALQDKVKKSIIVNIFSTKLTIENNNTNYYFKSESECNDFVNKIKEYNNNIKVTNSKEIIKLGLITNKDTLNAKIKELKTIKEKQEQKIKQQQILAQSQRKVSTISRSNNSREKTTNSNHPLNNYVYISSKYGYRSRGFHTGVDFATNMGASVYAWKSGTIIFASWSGNYGNYIRIRHDDGTESCYAHLSGYACSVGDYVNAHELIGYVGSTGNSTGPHLHWEVKVNGQFVNPLDYL